MGVKSSPDGFKEADDVADGMIPDSHIVNMINQIASAKDAQKQRDETATQQSLPETAQHHEMSHSAEKTNDGESHGNR
ncbi:MAG: hypothetical protein LV471_09795 [Nitrosomonas sp.]|nr:hypothetical protein [Nitrosomonas sp.]